MIRLIPELDGEGGSEVSPQFTEGQIVQHRRYGYRGVVVATTEDFQGSNEWYSTNQTQPPREQPWYHVLVDGGTHTTYAAQSSLEQGFNQQPIKHPLLPLFFSEFDGERYVRNDMPWEG